MEKKKMKYKKNKKKIINLLYLYKRLRYVDDREKYLKYLNIFESISYLSDEDIDLKECIDEYNTNSMSIKFPYYERHVKEMINNVSYVKPEKPCKYIYFDCKNFSPDKVYTASIDTFYNPDSDIVIRYDNIFKTAIEPNIFNILYLTPDKIKIKISNTIRIEDIIITCILLDIEAPNSNNCNTWISDVINILADKLEKEGYNSSIYYKNIHFDNEVL